MRATDLNAGPARQLLETAIESPIALLDVVDGDADAEASCDDEGFDSDSEPDAPGSVPDYEPADQRLVVVSADSDFQVVFDVGAAVHVTRTAEGEPAG